MMPGTILLLSGLLLLMNNALAEVNIAGVISENPLILNMKLSAESTVQLKLPWKILKFTVKRPTADCLFDEEIDKVIYTTSGDECSMSLWWGTSGFYMNGMANFFNTEEDVSLSIGKKAKIEVNDQLEKLKYGLFCSFRPEKVKDYYVANFTIWKYKGPKPKCNFNIVFNKTIQLYTGEEESELEKVFLSSSWLIPLAIFAGVVAVFAIFFVGCYLCKNNSQKAIARQEPALPNELATSSTQNNTTSLTVEPEGSQQSYELPERTSKEPPSSVKTSLAVKKPKVKTFLALKKSIVKIFGGVKGHNKEVLQEKEQTTSNEANRLYHVPAIENLAGATNIENVPVVEDVKKPYESFMFYKSEFPPAELIQLYLHSKCFVLKMPTSKIYTISLNFHNIANDWVAWRIKCGGQYFLMEKKCVPVDGTWRLNNNSKYTLKILREPHKFEDEFETIVLQCGKHVPNKQDQGDHAFLPGLFFDLPHFTPTHEILIYIGQRILHQEAVLLFKEQMDKRLNLFAEVDRGQRAALMDTIITFPSYMNNRPTRPKNRRRMRSRF